MAVFFREDEYEYNTNGTDIRLPFSMRMAHKGMVWAEFDANGNFIKETVTMGMLG